MCDLGLLRYTWAYVDIPGECVTWVYSDTLGFIQIHQVSV